MRRLQARRMGGRFTRNTLENTVGLHVGICDACNRFNPSPVGEPRPSVCKHCGMPLGRCAHGRCTEQFQDPAEVLAGGYKECGMPVVACDILHRWELCAEHAGAST